MAVCTSISLVKHLNDDCDLLQVTIDNSVNAYWIYSYADSGKYLNQEVIVDYRQDMLDGRLERFIATFIVPSVIQTLDATQDFKLFTDAVDNYSNVSFNDIQPGENCAQCIIYCTKSEYKTSPKAVWHELTVRDRNFRIATVRIFDYDVRNLELAGSYIRCDLARNKYGFQTDFVSTVNQECPPNPEIELAKTYVLNYFSNNTAAQTFMTKFDIINTLLRACDYEIGYGFVRMAMELSMVNSMRNITNDIDIDIIAEAILTSRGYLSRNSKLSSNVNNIMMAMSFPWKDKEKLLQLLDFESDLPEAKVLKNVKATVDELLEIRKGIEE